MIIDANDYKVSGDARSSKKQKMSNDDPIRKLLIAASTSLYEQSVQFPWEPVELGLDSDEPLWISYDDMLDITKGKTWLSASIMTVWIM